MTNEHGPGEEDVHRMLDAMPEHVDKDEVRRLVWPYTDRAGESVGVRCG